MCCTTKARIAYALRELMRERPTQKITVQDIMERTGMKRQSFYYHFQDVHQVLSWEVDRQLFHNVEFSPEQSYDEWCQSVMEELDSNAWFYRRAFELLGSQQTAERFRKIVQPQVCRLMLSEPFPKEQQLSEEEVCAVDFFSRALCGELMQRVVNSRASERERSQRCICMMGSLIHQNASMMMEC